MSNYGDVREDGYFCTGKDKSGRPKWLSPEARARNVEHRRKYARNSQVFAKLPATAANAGQATEYFVAADLIARGLSVTKPLNANGDHDLHVKCGSSWFTVQVKSAVRNKKTGNIRRAGGGDVVSDILAVVFMPTRQVRYTANKTPVPQELLIDFTILNPEVVISQFSNTSVTTAANNTKGSSGTQRKRKSASAAAHSTESLAGPLQSASANTEREAV